MCAKANKSTKLAVVALGAMTVYSIYVFLGKSYFNKQSMKSIEMEGRQLYEMQQRKSTKKRSDLSET